MCLASVIKELLRRYSRNRILHRLNSRMCCFPFEIQKQKAVLTIKFKVVLIWILPIRFIVDFVGHFFNIEKEFDVNFA